MISGASDCVVKDAQYVPNLVQAVRKALLRIAEKKTVALSPMPRADQFVVDENLPDIVFYLNTNGTILYANKAIKDLIGMPQKMVVNQPFEELVGPEEHKKWFRDYLIERDFHPNFRRVLSLETEKGDWKNFEINFGLREGDVIYGVARPVESKVTQDSAAEARSQLEASQELPIRIGPYRVLTLLGAGAMGRVYKGFDEQLERYVAIKVLSKKLSTAQDYLERFHHEAKLLATLIHPNIALIYYFGMLEGLPYFCMEFMPGGSLEALLRKNKVVPPETAVSYTMQVAIGLSKALEKGVVHLDVKPSNLMVAENDRIKIVDFGLARTTHQLQNIPNYIIGTPLYVAPEQVRGGMVDFRCDIFSLGMTFFQMLYGFVPHAESTVQEVFRRRVKEGLPPLNSLDAAIPKHLYEIINRMTHSNPTERYSSYSELIADLEQVRRNKLQEEPMVSLSPPAGSAVHLRGLLYDNPFAEILGKIASKKLSGKLTLSWFDLCKNVHFKNGQIIAVMSNQEGESFIDLLLKQNQLGSDKARKLGTGSSDLFLTYSSAMRELTHESRQQLSGDLVDLAWRILQGMFSWLVGEYLFEEGAFQGQGSMSIPTGEVLLTGVRGWMDFPTIHRRLYGGRCKIILNPDFQSMLPVLRVGPADAFMLFRFDKSIPFRDLMDLSGISEDEFFRLIYLFACAGILTLEEITEVRGTPPRPQRKPRTEKIKTPAAPISQEAPLRKDETPVRVPAVPLASAASKRPSGPQVSDLGQYYYQCAVSSFESKNYWATVEYCRKALTLKDEARTFRLMAKALATHEAFRHEAMEAYKKALEIEPSNIMIEKEMADLYYETGSYALARSRYQNVLKRNPDDQHSQQQLKEIARQNK
jgi:PAS domain S-box-containing protein